ncbi:MAG: hypothetical protein ABS956_12715 [Pseudomonas sp.]|uniref:hypothetical protein n=1 Tax=Pseudomonas TaxID=286 RepID=UPI0016452772|nr:hypothetical protein [Pseudomonas promysalinigenes]QXI33227.1 hypothetical protein HU725_019785 [Pseudomonas promysalinigenes]
MNRERGMVLLLALVFNLLLALLATSALRQALIETRLSSAMRESLQALKDADTVLLAGLQALQRSPPAPCNDCLPPAGPHDLRGRWQSHELGYFHLQNLGQAERAVHMPEGESVTLYRVTAVSRQPSARQVLEAVYAIPTAQPQAPKRILWRQRLRQD